MQKAFLHQVAHRRRRHLLSHIGKHLIFPSPCWILCQCWNRLLAARKEFSQTFLHLRRRRYQIRLGRSRNQWLRPAASGPNPGARIDGVSPNRWKAYCSTLTQNRSVYFRHRKPQGMALLSGMKVSASEQHLQSGHGVDTVCSKRTFICDCSCDFASVVMHMRIPSWCMRLIIHVRLPQVSFMHHTRLWFSGSKLRQHNETHCFLGPSFANKGKHTVHSVLGLSFENAMKPAVSGLVA